MSDSHTTRRSLLVRIKDARDEQAWSEFVDIYFPMIYGFGKKHGLQHADAIDLTQDVLRTIAQKAVEFVYDAQKGKFRGWLFTIVRNELRDFVKRQRRHPQATGGSDEQLANLLDREADLSALWEQEHEKRVFAWAAEQVRQKENPVQWEAFWRTAVKGHEAEVVAADLRLEVGKVYLCKSRVMAKLKELVLRYEKE
ncbi:MAG: sigma-70 family RNA polymerase sigma factor [Planctomycetales bacterium]|nr:sigma-70 family RNA polymerase sigma factor [Planctomycetales bacterium]